MMDSLFSYLKTTTSRWAPVNDQFKKTLRIYMTAVVEMILVKEERKVSFLFFCPYLDTSLVTRTEARQAPVSKGLT